METGKKYYYFLDLFRLRIDNELGRKTWKQESVDSNFLYKFENRKILADQFFKLKKINRLYRKQTLLII